MKVSHRAWNAADSIKASIRKAERVVLAHMAWVVSIAANGKAPLVQDLAGLFYGAGALESNPGRA